MSELRLDPITNREICQHCWEGIHWHKEVPRKDPRTGITKLHWVPCRAEDKDAVDACSGECNCIHKEMKQAAALEKSKIKSDRQAKRALLKEQLESSPLAVRSFQDAG